MWGQIGFHSILSFTTHGSGDKVAQLSRKTTDLATLLLNNQKTYKDIEQKHSVSNYC